MRIFVASDVHFEFHQDNSSFLPPLPCEEDIDVLVLAGDIGTKNEAVQGINKILNFYQEVSIVYIAGNHEFYQQEIKETLKYFKSTFEDNDRVFFLENETCVIDGYTFAGCTLWSGLDGMGDTVRNHMMQEADRFISDFRAINICDQKNGLRPFKPSDMLAKNHISQTWLEEVLRTHSKEKLIIVTHFPPLMGCRHEGIPVDSVSAYFQADCEELINTYQPLLWLYGHNHYSRMDRKGDTLLFSNQLGYPNEKTHYSQYQRVISTGHRWKVDNINLYGSSEKTND